MMDKSNDPSMYPISHVPSRSRPKKYTYPTINRFGLQGLAGALTRDGRDAVTMQILKEAHFLPRKGKAHVCQDGNILQAQESLPPSYDSIHYDEDSFGQMGLSGQEYSPLKLKRVYGRSVHPGNTVFNMTGVHKSNIVYVASNVLVFFDYYINSQSVLQGHQSSIVSMAKDEDSKYVATADSEHDNKPPTLIIWNAKTGFPMNTIPIISGDPDTHCSDIVSIGFVGRLNYIGILQFVRHNHKSTDENNGNRGDEESRRPPQRRQMLSIWKFGHPGQEPSLEVKLELPLRTRRLFQDKILFSTEIPSHFVTYSYNGYHIMFHTWLRHENRIVSYVPRGHLTSLTNTGMLLAGIWFQNSVLVTTTRGFIMEFKAQVPLGLEELQDPTHNAKEFRRFVKVQEGVALTALVAHKDFIVVGDALGCIKFLDTRFRIMRWTKTGINEPISSIAFHLTDYQPAWKFEMRKTYRKGGYDLSSYHRDGISAVHDYTFGGSKYRPPSETTVQRPPLHAPEECLDMVVGYENGGVAYFHLAEERFDMIVPESLNSPMNFMDVSPTTKHFVVCAEDSRIQLFDYTTFTLIHAKKLFSQAVMVTCVKFHPSGSFFVLGTDKGTLYFRSTYTLSLFKTPIRISKTRIERIEFSSCGTFMGIYDNHYTVILYYFNTYLEIWDLRGKHRSHYEPIVDLCFLYDEQFKCQRLFSLGKDKRIVEYHIGISTARTGLQILTATVLDNIPTSMVFANGFFHHGSILHIATTNNKIRMFDQDELKIRKTCQGPDYGDAVCRMLLISPEAGMGSEAELILAVMGRKIALMKSPIDGNPFKYMGVYAHSAPVSNAGVSDGGKHIFTICDGQAAVFMWTPNVTALENSELAGGAGIVPFQRYLDANLPPGISVVGDIKNIFYHLMLKRATDQVEFLKMSLTIRMSDIPTVMRTCGYFPTEQEVDQILEEAVFLQGLKYGSKQEEISFEDFIILYANHKDGGLATEEVIRAFDILGEQNASEEICIPRQKFVSMITTKGEKLQELDLPYFLPNFYYDTVSKTSVPINPIAEPWELKSSSAHSLLQSTKSDMSLGGETDSVVSFEKPQSVEEVLVVKQPSKAISLESAAGSEAQGEDDLRDTRRMPKEITLNFFLKQLLPEDPHAPFNLVQDKIQDDIYYLDRSGSGNMEAEKEIAALVKRWRGRREWKFFKQMFDQLKETSIERRLEVAVEMDYLYRTGKFRGNEPGNEESEEEMDIHGLTSETEVSSDAQDPGDLEEMLRPPVGILKASRLTVD